MEKVHNIHFRGTKITVKVSKEDSEDKYTMLEMAHPPNVGPALHIHPGAPEKLVLHTGRRVSNQIGKEVYHAQRGDFVFIPKGIEHKYQSGSNGGKVLVISPAGLEGTLKRLQTPSTLVQLLGSWSMR